MSSPQRSRTMASDFTKLFRHVSSHPRADNDAAPPVPTVVEPHASDAGPSSKKKITRIPLFGRPRKKSTASLSSSAYSSTGVVRESTDVSIRAPSPERDRRPSGNMLAAPKTKSPHSSLATKLSARFAQPPRQPTVLDPRASSSRASLLSTPSSTGLVPTSLVAPDARPSCDSVSSASSQRRSSTPIGTRPVITISRTDDLEEFRDLFTIDFHALKSNSAVTPSSSSSANGSPVVQPLEPTYRRGQTPASRLAASIRDHPHESQPAQDSSSDRPTDRGMTPGSPTPENTSHTLPTRRSSVRPKLPSLVGKPPSIPLPPLPSKPPPPVPTYTKSGSVVDVLDQCRRSRASTTTSLPDVPPTEPSAPESSKRSTPDQLAPPVFEADDFDIETASNHHLRAMLRKRNKHLVDVTVYMSRKEEVWASEKKAYEKKIAYLQRDLVRREAEVTGLKLIINDDEMMRQSSNNNNNIVNLRKPVPAGIINQSRLSPVSTQSDQEGATVRQRRAVVANYQSDSGAESPRSGTESTASSILRAKRIHQRSTALVGEFGYLARNGTTTTTATKNTTTTTKGKYTAAESSYSKRISTMSMTSSASSSSSLLPPSPSITVSSLSAIPEGSSSSPNDGLNNYNEESRRATRIAHRISASSMSSSSSTAASSSAYSMTAAIKRSRPPSIAQVLEKSSPSMDEILDKLRPFA